MNDEHKRVEGMQEQIDRIPDKAWIIAPVVVILVVTICYLVLPPA